MEWVEGVVCWFLFFSFYVLCIWYAAFQHMRPKGFLMNMRSIRCRSLLSVNACDSSDEEKKAVCLLAVLPFRATRTRLCSCSPLTSKWVQKMKYTQSKPLMHGEKFSDWKALLRNNAIRHHRLITITGKKNKLWFRHINVYIPKSCMEIEFTARKLLSFALFRMRNFRFSDWMKIID